MEVFNRLLLKPPQLSSGESFTKRARWLWRVSPCRLFLLPVRFDESSFVSTRSPGQAASLPPRFFALRISSGILLGRRQSD